MKKYSFIFLISNFLLCNELTTAYIKNTTTQDIQVKITYNQVCVDAQTGNTDIITHGPTTVFTLMPNEEQPFKFEPLSSRIADRCGKDITYSLLLHGKKTNTGKLQEGRYEIREAQGTVSLIKTY